MVHEEKKSLCKKAIKKWGIIAQTFMVMEECAELIDVLAKAQRGRASRDEIITELADVSIMIEQFVFYYGEIDFYAEKEKKLQRLKNKLCL